MFIHFRTGSGFVIGNFARQLKSLGYHDFCCVGTDINFAACSFSKELFAAYDLPADSLFIKSLSGIRSGSLDIVICNPPYVPTDQDELARMKVAENEHNKAVKEKKTEDVKNWRTWTKDANLVEAAWVGGEDGIEFFEELLNSAYV